MQFVDNQRKQNRLQGYNYAQDGWYFVTICTKNREEFLGKIENNEMVLNNIGNMAVQCWNEIPKHFIDVTLDVFVVMPNHVHGIIIIENVGNKNFCSLQKIPWQTQLSRSLSSIVRGFKIGVTKYCQENNMQNFGWQKSFYDHIIRSEKALYGIRQYIIDNPRNWKKDDLYIS